MTATELPSVRRVRAGPAPKTLIVDWAGGGRDVVDLTGVIASIAAFAPLEDANTFARVRRVHGGMGVGWPGGLDFSGSSLKLLAEEQRPMTAAEFVDWQKHYGLSNQEAADALGVSLATVKNYRKGSDIPKAVWVATRTMRRDPAVFRAHFRPRKAGRPRKTA